VKNVQPGADGINLPPFTNTTPADKLNWTMKPRANPDLTKMLARVNELIDTHGLKVTDLLCAFQERRVLPLQSRIHKIGHMSGRLDPSRVSTIELSSEEVARRVNKISVAKLAPDWRWGMEPYSQTNRPPKVRLAGCTMEPAVSFGRLGPPSFLRLLADSCFFPFPAWLQLFSRQQAEDGSDAALAASFPPDRVLKSRGGGAEGEPSEAGDVEPDEDTIGGEDDEGEAGESGKFPLLVVK